MYFFKYIFGIFYVVIIVAVCNRINTSAASPSNTEVQFISMKRAGSGSFKAQNKIRSFLSNFQVVENYSVFVFGRVIYKNLNERSSAFTIDIEQESAGTIQHFKAEQDKLHSFVPRISKEVPVTVNTYHSANFLRPSRIPICGVKP